MKQQISKDGQYFKFESFSIEQSEGARQKRYRNQNIYKEEYSEMTFCIENPVTLVSELPAQTIKQNTQNQNCLPFLASDPAQLESPSPQMQITMLDPTVSSQVAVSLPQSNLPLPGHCSSLYSFPARTLLDEKDQSPTSAPQKFFTAYNFDSPNSPNFTCHILLDKPTNLTHFLQDKPHVYKSGKIPLKNIPLTQKYHAVNCSNQFEIFIPEQQKFIQNSTSLYGSYSSSFTSKFKDIPSLDHNQTQSQQLLKSQSFSQKDTRVNKLIQPFHLGKDNSLPLEIPSTRQKRNCKEIIVSSKNAIKNLQKNCNFHKPSSQNRNLNKNGMILCQGANSEKILQTNSSKAFGSERSIPIIRKLPRGAQQSSSKETKKESKNEGQLKTPIIPELEKISKLSKKQNYSKSDIQEYRLGFLPHLSQSIPGHKNGKPVSNGFMNNALQFTENCSVVQHIPHLEESSCKEDINLQRGKISDPHRHLPQPHNLQFLGRNFQKTQQSEPISQILAEIRKDSTPKLSIIKRIHPQKSVDCSNISSSPIWASMENRLRPNKIEKLPLPSITMEDAYHGKKLSERKRDRKTHTSLGEYPMLEDHKKRILIERSKENNNLAFAKAVQDINHSSEKKQNHERGMDKEHRFQRKQNLSNLRQSQQKNPLSIIKKNGIDIQQKQLDTITHLDERKTGSNKSLDKNKILRYSLKSLTKSVSTNQQKNISESSLFQRPKILKFGGESKTRAACEINIKDRVQGENENFKRKDNTNQIKLEKDKGNVDAEVLPRSDILQVNLINIKLEKGGLDIESQFQEKSSIIPQKEEKRGQQKRGSRKSDEAILPVCTISEFRESKNAESTQRRNLSLADQTCKKREYTENTKIARQFSGGEIITSSPDSRSVEANSVVKLEIEDSGERYVKQEETKRNEEANEIYSVYENQSHEDPQNYNTQEEKDVDHFFGEISLIGHQNNTKPTDSSKIFESKVQLPIKELNRNEKLMPLEKTLKPHISLGDFVINPFDILTSRKTKPKRQPPPKYMHIHTQTADINLVVMALHHQNNFLIQKSSLQRPIEKNRLIDSVDQIKRTIVGIKNWERRSKANQKVAQISNMYMDTNQIKKLSLSKKNGVYFCAPILKKISARYSHFKAEGQDYALNNIQTIRLLVSSPQSLFLGNSSEKLRESGVFPYVLQILQSDSSSRILDIIEPFDPEQQCLAFWVYVKGEWQAKTIPHRRQDNVLYTLLKGYKIVVQQSFHMNLIDFPLDMAISMASGLRCMKYKIKSNKYLEQIHLGLRMNYLIFAISDNSDEQISGLSALGKIWRVGSLDKSSREQDSVISLEKVGKGIITLPINKFEAQFSYLVLICKREVHYWDWLQFAVDSEKKIVYVLEAEKRTQGSLGVDILEIQHQASSVGNIQAHLLLYREVNDGILQLASEVYKRYRKRSISIDFCIQGKYYLFVKIQADPFEGRRIKGRISIEGTQPMKFKFVDEVLAGSLANQECQYIQCE